MKNEEDFVYKYTVYWIDDYSDLTHLQWECRHFTLKENAQCFAKKHKKDNDFFQPIILRTISTNNNPNEYLVEHVINQKEIDALSSNFIKNKYKRIKY